MEAAGTALQRNVLVYLVNPLSLGWAVRFWAVEEALPRAGSDLSSEEIEALEEEYEALLVSADVPGGLEPPDFGLLSQFRDQAKSLDAASDRVGSITWTAPRVAGLGTNVAVMLVLSGWGDSGGFSIAPFGREPAPGKKGERALREILETLVEQGTWNTAKERWDGGLFFALPGAVLGETEEDATRAAEFVDYVCPAPANGGRGDRNCPGPQFLRDLEAEMGALIAERGVGTPEELEALQDALPSLPVGFYSQKGADEGDFSYTTGSEWYGDQPHVRGLGAERAYLIRSAQTTLQREEGRAVGADPTLAGLVARAGEEVQSLEADLSPEGRLQRPRDLSRAKERQDYLQSLRLAATVDEETGEEIVGGLTAQSAEVMTPKEWARAHKDLWRRAGRMAYDRPDALVLPLPLGYDATGTLAWQESPIQSIVFTLYGIAEEGGQEPVFGAVAQTDPLDLEGIKQLLSQAVQPFLDEEGAPVWTIPPEPGEAPPPWFSPGAALTAWAARATGLPALATEWSMRESQKEKLPVQYVLVATIAASGADVQERPYKVEGASLYLASFSFPTLEKSRVPDLLAIRLPVTGPAGLSDASGIRLASVSQADYGTFMTHVAKTSWRAGHGLVPRFREAREHGVAPRADFFRLKNVEALKSYKKELAGALSRKRPPAHPETFAYFKVVSAGVGGYMGGRLTDPIRAQRKKYELKGGTKRQAKGGKGGTELAPGRVQTIFGLARTICGASPKACAGGKVVRRDVASYFSLMQEYGIAPPERGDKAGMERALEQLLGRLGQASHNLYAHQAHVGHLPDEVGEEEVFTASILEEVAKPNTRRRRPRRPRRPRRNPLKSAAKAVAYLKTGKDAEEVGEELKALATARPSEDWSVTREKLGEYFPRKGPSGHWDLETRLQALTQADLVSRVGRAARPEGLGASLEGAEMPFSPEALRYIAEDAGLSLEETAAILDAQRERRKSRYTMQASSAICKNYRRRRLTTYRLPAALLGDRPLIPMRKDVLIWLSPKNFPEARVLTYRRGSHIDCDMRGPPSEMAGLLSRAIQSSLYWVAQKPRKRQVNTTIWVGRAGAPALYKAWEPGQPLSLSAVTANLKKANDRLAGWSLPIAPSERGQDDQKEAYSAAWERLFGVPSLAPEPVAPTHPPSLKAAPSEPQVAGPDPLQQALKGLGYKKGEIKAALAWLLGQGVPQSDPVANRLRAALSYLSPAPDAAAEVPVVRRRSRRRKEVDE